MDALFPAGPHSRNLELFFSSTVWLTRFGPDPKSSFSLADPDFRGNPFSFRPALPFFVRLQFPDIQKIAASRRTDSDDLEQPPALLFSGAFEDLHRQSLCAKAVNSRLPFSSNRSIRFSTPMELCQAG